MRPPTFHPSGQRFLSCLSPCGQSVVRHMMVNVSDARRELVHVRASETSTIINSKNESLPTGCLYRFLSHTHPHAHHQIYQSVLNKNSIKTPVASTLILRVIDVICLSSSSVNEIPDAQPRQLPSSAVQHTFAPWRKTGLRR